MMQNARITLHPTQQRLQVQVEGILQADATNTLELRERSYPPRHCFPHEDERVDLPTVSETSTYWPFKGRAVFFSLGESWGITWSYEEPIEGMEAIAGRVAFMKKFANDAFRT